MFLFVFVGHAVRHGLTAPEVFASNSWVLLRMWQFRQCYSTIYWLVDLPSGKHTKNYGTSPFLMGKSTINGHFQSCFACFAGPFRASPTSTNQPRSEAGRDRTPLAVICPRAFFLVLIFRQSRTLWRQQICIFCFAKNAPQIYGTIGFDTFFDVPLSVLFVVLLLLISLLWFKVMQKWGLFNVPFCNRLHTQMQTF